MGRKSGASSEGQGPTAVRATKYGALGLVMAAGLAILGLVMRSYLTAPLEPYAPPVAEVETSELVTRTSRGEFLDRRAERVGEQPAPRLGHPAPDFQLESFDGKSHSLRDFHGTPVLLNFWASWCPPCRKEMPDLQRFHEQYGARIRVLGINWDHERPKARTFLESHGITFPNLFDGEGKVFVRYRLRGLPTSFWVDASGVIRGMWRGAMSMETMVQGFRKTTEGLDERGSP